MKKLCIFIFSIVCSLVLFSTLLINAKDNDFNYNECNTFNYIGNNLNKAHYDLANRNDEIVGEDVLLTVLTHGLGGNASHWSSNSNDEFDYEQYSLIDSLAKSLDYRMNIVKISMDKMSIINTNKIDYTNEFGCEGGDNYHTIMVFETEQAYNSNDFVYSQFDYAVSKVVYDIKQTYGKLPKINLIGHSRGGLINLLYAMDHPYMVNQIFSMGTPYTGSSTAKIDVDYMDCEIGSGNACQDGEKDIIDSDLYNSYMTRWNNNYDKYYKNIDVTAMGARTSVDYLCKVLLSKNTIDYIINPSDNKIISTLEYAGIYVAFTEIVSYLEAINTTSILRHYLGIEYIGNKLTIIGDLIVDIIKQIQDESNKIGEKIEIVYDILKNEIVYDDIANRLVWNNDFFVNLDSALGYGYKGFKSYSKTVTFFNSTDKLAFKNMPPVTHNLLTKNSTLNNKILSKIEMNGKTTSNYLYTVMQNGCIRIDSYIGQDRDIVVPCKIDGRTVLEVNREAFNDMDYHNENGIINNNESIKSIVIPSTINTVDKTAFMNCQSLEKITFSDYGLNEEYDLEDNIKSSILDLDYVDMFENLNKLKEINIDSYFLTSVDGILYNKDRTTLLKYPSGKLESEFVLPNTVKSISDKAFKNSILASIDLNNTTNIGSNVFENCVNLTNINANKLVGVGLDSFKNTKWLNEKEENNNSLFISIGKVLIEYKTTENNVEISYDELKNYISISRGAFKDLESLKINIPSNITSIDTNAFQNITELEIYIQNRYNNINKITDEKTNITINILNELETYYCNIGLKNYNTFEGSIGNTIYRISELNYKDGSLLLYVLNTDIESYDNKKIKINEIILRDQTTLLPAYKIKGLYLDSKHQNKYDFETINIDNNQCFYIELEPIYYTVLIDYENGDDIDESEKSEKYYLYNGIVDLPISSKMCCEELNRFKYNGKIYYVNNEIKISDLFDFDCDNLNPKVELKAVWDYTIYKIAYHEYDINNNIKHISKNIHIIKY